MLARLFANRRGNVAILFALLVVPLIGAVGLGVDFMRAGAERARAQEALDAAVLAGVRHLMAHPNEVAQSKQKALKAYRANFRSDANAVFTFDAAGVLRGTVDDALPTTFARLLGQNAMNISISSAASLAGRGMELALVLDVSGSMSGEIPSLRMAVTSLLDEIYGNADTAPNVWVALVPFSGRVNVINYGAGWLTGPPTMSNGPTAAVGNSCKVNSVNTNYPRLCPQRRAPTADQDDTLPSAAAFNEYTSDWEVCPVPRAIGLSPRRSDIQPFVNSLCAGHGTSTYEGMAWGWRALSPRWQGLWGSATLPKSNADSPGKYAVIMTDGQNHPNQSGDALSTAEADAKLLQTCQAMKAEGITIFAVTFNMGGALASLYQQCTSKPEYQYDAESGAELDAVFTEIGKIVSRGDVRLLE